MNKSALLVALCAAHLFAQNPNSAVFPNAIPSDSDLLVASNLYSTVLSSAVTATSALIPVASTTGLLLPAALTLDTGTSAEIVKVCSVFGRALLVCSGGRGFDHTVATAHAAGARVVEAPVAWQLNQHSAEIKAIASALLPGVRALSSTYLYSVSIPTMQDGTVAEVNAFLADFQPGDAVTIAPPVEICDQTFGGCTTYPLGFLLEARVASPGIVAIRVLNVSGAVAAIPTAQYQVTRWPTTTKVSLTFGSIDDGTCKSQSVPLAGALPGGRVVIGAPRPIEAGLMPDVAATGINVATVTLCNWSGADVTPAVADYSIRLGQ